MCFTVNVNLIREELESRYGATLIDPGKYRPSYYYHAFSLPEIPAVCSERQDKIQLLKWGLIPSWTRTVADANIIRYKTFNARAESIETKPSFASSFRSRRCIIPVKGFFEWQHTGKSKIPWYIFHRGDEILSLAGIYDEWVENNTGEHLLTFSIITTEANDMMAEIHNSGKRMPVILEKSEDHRWLDINTPQGDAMSLLKPCPPDILNAHTISPLINEKASNRNTSEIIRPYSYNLSNELF